MSVDAVLLSDDIDSGAMDYQDAPEDSSAYEQSSLREEVKRSEREKREKEEKELAVAHINPIKKWSASFLRQSWLNIFITFGLSFFGVFGIIFLRSIFGKKYFCRLGDEWAPPGVVGLSEEEQPKLKNIVEQIGVVFACLAICLLILCVLFLISMIAGFIDNPLRALKEILKETFKNW